MAEEMALDSSRNCDWGTGERQSPEPLQFLVYKPGFQVNRRVLLPAFQCRFQTCITADPGLPQLVNNPEYTMDLKVFRFSKAAKLLVTCQEYAVLMDLGCGDAVAVSHCQPAISASQHRRPLQELRRQTIGLHAAVF